MKKRIGAIGATLGLVSAGWSATLGDGEPELSFRGSRPAGRIRSGVEWEWGLLEEDLRFPDTATGFLPSRYESRTGSRRRLPRERRSGQFDEEDRYWVREGFYAGALLPFQGIEGDFDGDDALFETGGNEVILVPEIDPGLGFGVVVGWRTPEIAFEMTYRQTWHDTEFGSADLGDAVLYAVDLDVKPYLSTSEPVQPFLLFGMSIPVLELEDARSDDGGTTFDRDATLSGAGFNFGGGVSLFAGERLAMHLTGGYRLAWFFDAEGEEIDDDLDGHGFFASVGVTFTF